MPSGSHVWRGLVWFRFVWRGHSCPRTAGSAAKSWPLCHASWFLVILLALAPFSFAQRSGGGHSAPSHAAAPHQTPHAGRLTLGRNSSRSRRHVSDNSLPFPFLSDFYDSDDIYSTGYPVASEPPPYLLEAARGLAGPGGYPLPEMPQAGNNSGSQPLMIELQGDRYVRVNSTPIDGEAQPLAMAQPERGRAAGPNSAPTAASTPQPLPPVTLIYRDGHSEQVRDYTIANDKLYARGDLYTDGYWNKAINLADLNLPETLQANASRNVSFTLPSSPNEVIARF